MNCTCKMPRVNDFPHDVGCPVYFPFNNIPTPTPQLYPIPLNPTPQPALSSDFSHSTNCSGMHIGAHCLIKDDLRGAIVSLTSRMLDNPDKDGIYPTTVFYDALEQFVSTLLKENAAATLREVDEGVLAIMKKHGFVGSFRRVRHLIQHKLTSEL